MCCGRKSLSARRAWIEIKKGCNAARHSPVALRKESVDRNGYSAVNLSHVNQSLSARRAWIEIIARMVPRTARLSLSARRAWIEID